MTLVKETCTRTDAIYPFMVETLGCRGRIIRLEHTIDTILTQHRYTDLVSRLLGEMVLLVGLLGDMLKNETVVTAQLKTEGIIDCVIADYMEGGRLRGYAAYNETDLQNLVNQNAALHYHSLLHEGYLSISVDPQLEKQRYQGIVALEGKDVGVAVENYFLQSEQVRTVIILAVGQIEEQGQKRWSAGGLMLQKMAHQGGIGGLSEEESETHWKEAEILARSVRADELLDPHLSANDLLWRLFHEQEIRVFEPKAVCHGCRCSRERAEAIVNSLTPEQVEEFRLEGGVIITCQFCGKEERFDV